MEKEKIKINQMVKITNGIFKGFFGEFVGECQEGESKKYGWEKGKKWDGNLMIKIEMFKHITFIPCDKSEIKEIIPKCSYCQKILNLSFREMSDFLICQKCLEERKNGKYFHYDKMKWLKKPTEVAKTMMKNERDYLKNNPPLKEKI